jgi:hypothetical protein
MAKGNLNWWGCTRIQGTVANLGHTGSRSTVANIRGEMGLNLPGKRDEPVLEDVSPNTLGNHFFTVKVFTWRGLVT